MTGWKTTLVTMYFDLTALADRAAQTRPLEFYLEHGRKVLSVRAPLVV